METPEHLLARLNRREILSLLSTLTLGLALRPENATNVADLKREPMTITCFIRYQIDPFQKDQFRKYAENWGRIIPRLGGHLVGYFFPYEGTNDIAWGLVAFESLATYEQYRDRLRRDPESRANFAMAQSKRLILREERTFLEVVDGTFQLPAAASRPE